MTRLSAVPEVEAVPWPSFLAERFDWRQGEHVTMLGPTGTGKTTAAAQILHKRKYVVAIGTKPKDGTLDRMRRTEGYQVVPELPTGKLPPSGARVIVWPKPTTLDRAEKRRMAETIRRTLDRAYSAGGWCVFGDEIAYLCRTLGLGPEVVDIYGQGRSNGVSFVGGSQRPRHIPVDAYSAASHLFLWRTNDDYDVKRLSGLNGVDSKLVQRIVQRLPRHHCLYVSTRDGDMLVTLAPRL